ncbi:MAG: hypothetical protein H0V01_12255 [Bacteroidetes bacterium]|nr:hypothetical protein [Bacteroidota bacterium]HET6245832.1 hypothetical protein [Bacteroidia bacterium]
MNLKKIFGALLTLLGVIGLIYGAILFVNISNDTVNTRALITYGIIGFIFFIAGIGLIRNLDDKE